MNRAQALQFLAGMGSASRISEPTRAHEVTLGDGVIASIRSSEGDATMAVVVRHETEGTLCAIDICADAVQALTAVMLEHAKRLPARAGV